MSTVGRVFIVLNLFLTCVLVGYVGAFLYSGNHYRAAYEGLQANGAQQITHYSQENAGLLSENKTLKGQLAERENELVFTNKRYNEVWGAYIAERAAMKSLDDNFQDFATKIQGWEAIYTNLTNKVEEYNNEIASLQRKQTQAAEAQRIARNREVTAAAFRVRSDLHVKALQEQILALQTKVEELQAREALYVKLTGQVIKQAPDGLVGRVLSVSEDGTLMTVEFSGAATTQLTVGWTFMLHSETQFKGFARIIEVHGTGSATLRLFSPAVGAEPPAANDRVRPAAL